LRMRLAALLLAPGPDFVTRPVHEAALVFGGLAGDVHHGLTREADARTPWHRRGTPIANTRQVSLVSQEELAAVAAALDIAALDPALVGANCVLADAPDLTATPPGTRLIFPSGATLFVAEANPPCRQPGRKLAAAHGRADLELAFVKAARGRRGIVALVEREGPVAAGDAIKLLAPVRG
jgi:MOSC domain-containing protein YiiM